MKKVIPDFKTVKFVQEFKKAFGRRAKPPKGTMNLLVEVLTSAVGSGPATSVSGNPEDGLVVKVMSSATGERIIHHVKLSTDLLVLEHRKQKLGEPDSSTTIGSNDLYAKFNPRQATHFRDGDVVPTKKSRHAE